MRRCTKIVATIGPASSDRAGIRGLIQAGMNVARLNFSHGDYETHARVIRTIREESNLLGIPVTILQDLQGPKIRIGDIAGGQVELQAGQTLVLCAKDCLGDTERISVDLPELPVYVKPGSRILLSDGNLELVVRGCNESEIITEVILGGTLKSNQGVNLPGVSMNIPAFTEKDQRDLEFGLANGVDAVAMSFIRTAEYVTRIRTAIARLTNT